MDVELKLPDGMTGLCHTIIAFFPELCRAIISGFKKPRSYFFTYMPRSILRAFSYLYRYSFVELRFQINSFVSVTTPCILFPLKQGENSSSGIKHTCAGNQLFPLGRDVCLHLQLYDRSTTSMDGREALSQNALTMTLT